MLQGECAGEKRGWGKKQVCSRQRKSERWSSILRVFTPSLKEEVLGEVSGEDVNRIFISLSRCLLSGWWSLLIGWHQGRGSLVIVSVPEVGHVLLSLVLLLFWAWT